MENLFPTAAGDGAGGSSSSERNPVEELAEEFAERYRRGERPSLQEYTDKYPEWADKIRALFPALVVMEKVRPTPDEATGPFGGLRGGDARLERLGDYRILREVGRGGMGVVYEAEQVSLGRRVALKVLAAQAVLDPRHLLRFQREAKAAGRLHHTNIVPVHGVGEQDGLYYYVMQFIAGLGLDEVLAELRRLRQAPAGGGAVDWAGGGRGPSPADMAQSLLTGRLPAGEPERPEATPAPGPVTPGAGSASSSAIHLPGQPEGSSLSESGWPYARGVARVGVQVAEALAYAHGQGILHRDIKPSNLLLDSHGTVWVTDFGLAKAETDPDNVTHTGDIVGTLRYMAPERFQGKADARCDVYALGLTLYELLTLRPAFAEADRTRLIAQVLHDEPPRPRRLDPAVPRDLETIVLKAIARDPARRYQTPAELAEDLQRFLDDKPIRARRAGWREQVWRWCRRNPWPAGLAAALLVLLVLVAVGSSLFALHLAAARDEADRNAGAAQRAQKKAEDEGERSQRRLVRLTVASGARLMGEGDLSGSLLWFTEALRLDQGKPRREEMHRLRLGMVSRHFPRLAHVWFHEEYIEYAEFSRDGRWVVTASQDHTARVWDAATGRPVTPPLKHQAGLHHASFSPHGRRVVTASMDGTAVVWQVPGGKPLTAPLRHGSWVNRAHFSPDGRWVVTASKDGTARLWDAGSGQLARTLPHRGEVGRAGFSPHGRLVLTASGQDGAARIWEAATGKLLATLQHGSWVHDAAFSPDGRRVVTASFDHTARVWRTDTGQPVTPPLRHGHWVRHASFSPDGRRVLTASDDHTARVWDAATGAPVLPPLPHGDYVWHAAFSPDGRRVVTASYDHTARVWDATTGAPLTPPLRHIYRVRHVAFSPDGRRVLSAGFDHTVRVWDLSAAALASPFLNQSGALMYTGFSPDGRRVLTITEGLRYTWFTPAGRQFIAHTGNRTARVWEVSNLQPGAPPVQVGAQTSCLAFSRAGDRLALGGRDGTIRVRDLATDQALPFRARHKGRVSHVAFSRDGSRVVSASDDGTARVWDAATGRPIMPPLKHQGPVLEACFSPDGDRVLTGSADRTGGVWDARTGLPLTRPLEHPGTVTGLAFSPDGRRVIMGGGLDSARVWDVATGAPVTPPLGHGRWLGPSSFSPDGRHVATSSADQTARVWDAATGAPVTPLLPHSAQVWYSAFGADGRLLVTVSGGDANVGETRVWDAATGQPVSPPLRHHGTAVHAAFSPDGRRLLAADFGGTVRFWDLTPTDWPLPDLVLLAQVLAGRQIDPTDCLVLLESKGSELSPQAGARETFRRAWETLRLKYPDYFSPSPAQVRAWHRQEADAAERDGQWFAALFHLNRLLEREPDRKDLRERRDRARRELAKLR